MEQGQKSAFFKQWMNFINRKCKTSNRIFIFAFGARKNQNKMCDSF